jgi:hypothetical protein
MVAGRLVSSSVKFGIWDPPPTAFRPGEGRVLGELPQTEEDLKAGRAVLEGWVTGKVVEQMDWDQALGIVTEKKVLVSNSFVV